MSKQTKIVATISDLRCDVEFIRQLYNAGMNVVRMNSAHMDEEGFTRIVNNVRTVSPKIAVLMDTKGPEIRTSKTADRLHLTTGQRIFLAGGKDNETTEECIYVSYDDIVKDLNVGQKVLFDDGEIELEVIAKEENRLLCEAKNEGSLGSRKSVNVPGVSISLPSLTEKDRRNIDLGIKLGVDFIAHSFVRTGRDVLDIQEILDAHNSKIKIIAKIENQEGVDNIDDILKYAYGLMVARGDLGIEVPQEKIPGIQRILIRKAVQAKKPVIIATQMLHTMIQNPRPTRAEITDIANAIYYRTDALMLSGETAYGKYPIEAVQTMAKIAEEAEKTKLAENDITIPFKTEEADVVSFLAKQAVEATTALKAKAIITESVSGKTARHIAAYRSSSPLLAICHNEDVMRTLSLSYGVEAELWNKDQDANYLVKALEGFVAQGLVKSEDLVAFISGAFKTDGGTSFLELNVLDKIKDSSRFEA